MAVSVAPPPPSAAGGPGTGPAGPAGSGKRGSLPWSSLLLSALGAVLVTAASPPADLWWLGWVAPAPLFAALLREAGGGEGARSRPFLTAFVFGAVLLLTLVPWFAGFTAAGYPVAAGYWGLVAGLWALGLHRVLRACSAAWTVPALAAGYTLLEWLRAQGPLAFPWGTLAATQAKMLPVIQLLDLTGAYGLTFLMALCAAALAAAVLPGEPQRRRAGLAWGVLAVNLAFLSAGRGLWILSRPAPVGETVRAAVVQASESRQSTGAAVVCISPPWEYEDRTAEAVRQGAELIAWPETACETDLVAWPSARVNLARLLAPGGAHLLAGNWVRDQETRQETNSAVMLSPDGNVLGRYAKVQIVPFGEYLPLRPLLGWTTRLGMPATDLRPGRSWVPVPWPRGRVGVSICFESAFGGISRRMIHQGANLLAVLTSDGWAGRDAAGRQHAAFAPLRAVEVRRSVVRAAATGISALLDPYGRPLRQIPMFTRGVAVAELPLRTDRTLYAVLGDWPVPLSAVLLLAAVLLPARRTREQHLGG